MDAWRVNPMLTLVAAQQSGVFSRGQALRCGYTPQGIRERVQSGRWERVRYGQYAESVDLSRLPPWDRELARHRRSVFAALNAVRSGAFAVSHQSALILHGLPVWGLDLSQVHLSRLDRRRHSGPVAGIRYHRGELTEPDLAHLDGRLVTAVPRAVVETACTASFEAAVVVADAALRDHPFDQFELDRLLEVTEFWPGSATARAALSIADRRAESVGESRLRVLLYNHGFPAPDLQVEYHDRGGFIGRVDFAFPEFRTIVEFDGAVKYAGATEEALVREKVREDRLRALGFAVVRSVWSDLDHPAYLLDRLHSAFALARHPA